MGVWSAGIFMLFTGMVVQGQRVNTDIYPIRLPQGFVLEGLSGCGSAKSTLSTAADIGSGNPAIISDFKRPSIGISEQFETKIYPAWYAGIGFKRGRTFLPQSAGLIVPFGNWRFGAGFSQRYNSIMDYGEMSVTTVDHPEGTGEVFSALNETHIQSYSFLSETTLYSQENGWLNIGGRFSIDRLSYLSKIWREHAHAVDYEVSWSAGFRYDLRIDSVYLKIGMFFERGSRFRTNASYSGTELLQPIDISEDGNNPSIRVQSNEWPVVANVPSRLHAGVFLGSAKSTFITLDYTQFSMGQAIELFQDSRQVAGSACLRFLRFMTVSVGFLSSETHSVYASYYPLESLSPPSVLYFTAGCIWHVANFELDLALATSKNTETNPLYRQTLLKAGMNYHL
jgi:hypothetical protein